MTENSNKISNPQRRFAAHITQTLNEAGHTAYFAGGCVRDFLLGSQAKDYDVATSATPDQVAALFPKSDLIGAHFGVVLVKDKVAPTEVATFRTDGSYNDNRHPEHVTFSTPEHDAQRRDFTINGLFQDPHTDEIIDYVGGRADLEKKIIRAIGDPAARFQEDALRLMRAVRLATVLDFEIEANTAAAIKKYGPLLINIATERIRDEFSKIITHPNRAKGINLLVALGLIGYFLHEVLMLIGCEQPPQWHPEGDVYTHTKIALSLLPKDASLSLCLAMLLHDIAKPPTATFDTEQQRIRFNGHDKLGATMSEEILRRLRYPNDIVEAVREMVAHHMQFMNVKDMRIAKLKRFMARPTFSDEMHLHYADCASSNGFRDNYDYLNEKLEQFANEPLLPQPLITGRDLLNLNIPTSPFYSTILTEVQTEQLEGRLTTRDEALAFIQKYTS